MFLRIQQYVGSMSSLISEAREKHRSEFRQKLMISCPETKKRRIKKSEKF